MALLVILAFLLQTQLTLGQISGMQIDDSFDFDSWEPDPTGDMAFMAGTYDCYSKDPSSVFVDECHACSATCGNPTPPCKEVCASECICKKGYFVDDNTGRCVSQKNCPPPTVVVLSVSALLTKADGITASFNTLVSGGAKTDAEVSKSLSTIIDDLMQMLVQITSTDKERTDLVSAILAPVSTELKGGTALNAIKNFMGKKTFTASQFSSVITAFLKTARKTFSTFSVTRLQSMTSSMMQPVYSKILTLSSTEVATFSSAQLQIAADATVSNLNGIISNDEVASDEYIVNVVTQAVTSTTTILNQIATTTEQRSAIVTEMLAPIQTTLGSDTTILQPIQQLLMSTSTSTSSTASISISIRSVFASLKTKFSFMTKTRDLKVLVSNVFGAVFTRILSQSSAQGSVAMTGAALQTMSDEIIGSLDGLISSDDDTITSKVTDAVLSFSTVLSQIAPTPSQRTTIVNQMFSSLETTIGANAATILQPVKNLLSKTITITRVTITIIIRFFVISVRAALPNFSQTSLTTLTTSIFAPVYNEILSKPVEVNVTALTPTDLQKTCDQQVAAIQTLFSGSATDDTIVTTVTQVVQQVNTILNKVATSSEKRIKIVNDMIAYVIKVMGGGDQSALFQPLINLLSQSGAISTTTITVTIRMFIIKIRKSFSTSVTVSTLETMAIDMFSPINTEISDLPQPTDLPALSSTDLQTMSDEVISSVTSILEGDSMPSEDDIVTTVSAAVQSMNTILISVTSSDSQRSDVVNAMLKPVVDLIGADQGSVLGPLKDLLLSSSVMSSYTISINIRIVIKSLMGLFPATTTGQSIVNLIYQVFAPVTYQILEVPSSVGEQAPTPTQLQTTSDAIVSSLNQMVNGESMPDDDTMTTVLTDVVNKLIPLLGQIATTQEQRVSLVKQMVEPLQQLGGVDALQPLITLLTSSSSTVSTTTITVTIRILITIFRKAVSSTVTGSNLVDLNAAIFAPIYTQILSLPTTTDQTPLTTTQMQQVSDSLVSSLDVLVTGEAPSDETVLQTVTDVVSSLPGLLENLAAGGEDRSGLVKKMVKPLEDLLGSDDASLQALIALLSKTTSVSRTTITITIRILIIRVRAVLPSGNQSQISTQISKLTKKIFEPVYSSIASVPASTAAPLQASDLLTISSTVSSSISALLSGPSFPSDEETVSTVATSVFNVISILNQIAPGTQQRIDLVTKMLQPFETYLGGDTTSVLQSFRYLLTKTSTVSKTTISITIRLLIRILKIYLPSTITVTEAQELSTQIIGVITTQISLVPQGGNQGLSYTEMASTVDNLISGLDGLGSAGGFSSEDDITTTVSSALTTVLSILNEIAPDSDKRLVIVNKMLSSIEKYTGSGGASVIQSFRTLLMTTTTVSQTTISITISNLVVSLKGLFPAGFSSGDLSTLTLSVFSPIYNTVLSGLTTSTSSSTKQLQDVVDTAVENLSKLVGGEVTVEDVVSGTSQVIKSLKPVIDQLAGLPQQKVDLVAQMTATLESKLPEGQKDVLKPVVDYLTGASTVEVTQEQITTVVTTVQSLNLSPSDQTSVITSVVVPVYSEILVQAPTSQVQYSTSQLLQITASAEVTITGIFQNVMPSLDVLSSTMLEFVTTINTVLNQIVTTPEQRVSIVNQIVEPISAKLNEISSGQNVDLLNTYTNLLVNFNSIANSSLVNMVTIVSAGFQTDLFVSMTSETITTMFQQSLQPVKDEIKSMAVIESVTVVTKEEATQILTSITMEFTVTIEGEMSDDQIVSIVVKVLNAFSQVFDLVAPTSQEREVMATAMVQPFSTAFYIQDSSVINTIISLLTKSKEMSSTSLTITIRTLVQVAKQMAAEMNIQFSMEQVMVLIKKILAPTGIEIEFSTEQTTAGPTSPGPLDEMTTEPIVGPSAEVLSPQDINGQVDAVVTNLNSLVNGTTFVGDEQIVTTVVQSITSLSQVLVQLAPETEARSTIVDQMLLPIKTLVGEDGSKVIAPLKALLTSTSTVTEVQANITFYSMYFETLKPQLKDKVTPSDLSSLTNQITGPLYIELLTTMTDSGTMTYQDLQTATDSAVSKLEALVTGDVQITQIVTAVEEVITTFVEVLNQIAILPEQRADVVNQMVSGFQGIVTSTDAIKSLTDYLINPTGNIDSIVSSLTTVVEQVQTLSLSSSEATSLIYTIVTPLYNGILELTPQGQAPVQPDVLKEISSVAQSSTIEVGTNLGKVPLDTSTNGIVNVIARISEAMNQLTTTFDEKETLIDKLLQPLTIVFSSDTILHIKYLYLNYNTITKSVIYSVMSNILSSNSDAIIALSADQLKETVTSMYISVNDVISKVTQVPVVITYTSNELTSQVDNVKGRCEGLVSGDSYPTDDQVLTAATFVLMTMDTVFNQVAGSAQDRSDLLDQMTKPIERALGGDFTAKKVVETIKSLVGKSGSLSKTSMQIAIRGILRTIRFTIRIQMSMVELRRLVSYVFQPLYLQITTTATLNASVLTTDEMSSAVDSVMGSLNSLGIGTTFSSDSEITVVVTKSVRSLMKIFSQLTLNVGSKSVLINNVLNPLKKYVGEGGSSLIQSLQDLLSSTTVLTEAEVSAGISKVLPGLKEAFGISSPSFSSGDLITLTSSMMAPVYTNIISVLSSSVTLSPSQLQQAADSAFNSLKGLLEGDVTSETVVTVVTQVLTDLAPVLNQLAALPTQKTNLIDQMTESLKNLLPPEQPDLLQPLIDYLLNPSGDTTETATAIASLYEVIVNLKLDVSATTNLIYSIVTPVFDGVLEQTPTVVIQSRQEITDEMAKSETYVTSLFKEDTIPTSDEFASACTVSIAQFIKVLNQVEMTQEERVKYVKDSMGPVYKLVGEPGKSILDTVFEVYLNFNSFTQASSTNILSMTSNQLYQVLIAGGYTSRQIIQVFTSAYEVITTSVNLIVYEPTPTLPSQELTQKVDGVTSALETLFSSEVAPSDDEIVQSLSLAIETLNSIFLQVAPTPEGRDQLVGSMVDAILMTFSISDSTTVKSLKAVLAKSNTLSKESIMISLRGVITNIRMKIKITVSYTSIQQLLKNIFQPLYLVIEDVSEMTTTTPEITTEPTPAELNSTEVLSPQDMNGQIDVVVTNLNSLVNGTTFVGDEQIVTTVVQSITGLIRVLIQLAPETEIRSTIVDQMLLPVKTLVGDAGSTVITSLTTLLTSTSSVTEIQVNITFYSMYFTTIKPLLLAKFTPNDLSSLISQIVEPLYVELLSALTSSVTMTSQDLQNAADSSVDKLEFLVGGGVLTVQIVTIVQEVITTFIEIIDEIAILPEQRTDVVNQMFSGFESLITSTDAIKPLTEYLISPSGNIDSIVSSLTTLVEQVRTLGLSSSDATGLIYTIVTPLYNGILALTPQGQAPLQPDVLKETASAAQSSNVDVIVNLGKVPLDTSTTNIVNVISTISAMINQLTTSYEEKESFIDKYLQPLSIAYPPVVILQIKDLYINYNTISKSVIYTICRNILEYKSDALRALSVDQINEMVANMYVILNEFISRVSQVPVVITYTSGELTSQVDNVKGQCEGLVSGDSYPTDDQVLTAATSILTTMETVLNQLAGSAQDRSDLLDQMTKPIERALGGDFKAKKVVETIKSLVGKSGSLTKTSMQIAIRGILRTIRFTIRIQMSMVELRRLASYVFQPLYLQITTTATLNAVALTTDEMSSAVDSVKGSLNSLGIGTTFVSDSEITVVVTKSVRSLMKIFSQLTVSVESRSVLITNVLNPLKKYVGEGGSSLIQSLQDLLSSPTALTEAQISAGIANLLPGLKEAFGNTFPSFSSGDLITLTSSMMAPVYTNIISVLTSSVTLSPTQLQEAADSAFNSLKGLLEGEVTSETVVTVVTQVLTKLAPVLDQLAALPIQKINLINQMTESLKNLLPIEQPDLLKPLIDYLLNPSGGSNETSAAITSVYEIIVNLKLDVSTTTSLIYSIVTPVYDGVLEQTPTVVIQSRQEITEEMAKSEGSINSMFADGAIPSGLVSPTTVAITQFAKVLNQVVMTQEERVKYVKESMASIYALVGEDGKSLLDPIFEIYVNFNSFTQASIDNILAIASNQVYQFLISKGSTPAQILESYTYAFGVIATTAESIVYEPTPTLTSKELTQKLDGITSALESLFSAEVTPSDDVIVQSLSQTIETLNSIFLQVAPTPEERDLLVGSMVDAILTTFGISDSTTVKSLKAVLAKSNTLSNESIMISLRGVITSIRIKIKITVSYTVILQLFKYVFQPLYVIIEEFPQIPVTTQPPVSDMSTVELVQITNDLVGQLDDLFGGENIPAVTEIVSTVSRVIYTFKFTILAQLSSKGVDVKVVIGKMVEIIMRIFGEAGSSQLDLLAQLLTDSTDNLDGISAQLTKIIIKLGESFLDTPPSGLQTLTSDIFNEVYVTFDDLPSQPMSIDELRTAGSQLKDNIDVIIQSGGGKLPKPEDVVSTISETIFSLRLIIKQLSGEGLSVSQIVQNMMRPIIKIIGSENQEQLQILIDLLSGSGSVTMVSITSQVTTLVLNLQKVFPTGVTVQQVTQMNLEVFNNLYRAIDDVPVPSSTDTNVPITTPTPSTVNPSQLIDVTTQLEGDIQYLFEGGTLPSVDEAVLTISSTIYSFSSSVLVSLTSLGTLTKTEVVEAMIQPIIGVIGEENKGLLEVFVTILSTSSPSLDEITQAVTTFFTSVQSFDITVTVTQMVELNANVFATIYSEIQSLPTPTPTHDEIVASTNLLLTNLNDLMNSGGDGLPDTQEVITVVSQTIFNFRLTILSFVTSSTVSVNDMVEAMIKPILDIIGKNNRSQVQIIIDLLTSTTTLNMQFITKQVTTLVTQLQSFFSTVTVSELIQLNSNIFSPIIKGIPETNPNVEPTPVVEPTPSGETPTGTTPSPQAQIPHMSQFEYIRAVSQLEGDFNMLFAGDEMPSFESVVTQISQTIFTVKSTVMYHISVGMVKIQDLTLLMQPFVGFVGDSEATRSAIDILIKTVTSSTTTTLDDITAQVKILEPAFQLTLSAGVTTSQIRTFTSKIFSAVFTLIAKFPVEAVPATQLASETSKIVSGINDLLRSGGSKLPDSQRAISVVSRTIFTLRMTIFIQLRYGKMNITKIVEGMLKPIVRFVGESNGDKLTDLKNLLTNPDVLDMETITSQVTTIMPTLVTIFTGRTTTVDQLLQLTTEVFTSVYSAISDETVSSTDPSNPSTTPSPIQDPIPSVYELTSSTYEIESTLTILLNSGNGTLPSFESSVTSVSQALFKLRTTVLMGLSRQSVDVVTVVKSMMKPIITLVGEDNRGQFDIIITILTSSSSMSLEDITTQVRSFLTAMSESVTSTLTVSQFLSIGSTVFSPVFSAIVTVSSTSETVTTAQLTSQTSELVGKLDALLSSGGSQLPSINSVVTTVTQTVFNLKVSIFTQLTTSSMSVTQVVNAMIEPLVRIVGESNRAQLDQLVQLLTGDSLDMGYINTQITSIITTFQSIFPKDVTITSLTSLTKEVFRAVFSAISNVPIPTSPPEVSTTPTPINTPAPITPAPNTPTVLKPSELISVTTQLEGGLNDLFDSADGQLPSASNVISIVSQTIYTLRTTVVAGLTSETVDVNQIIRGLTQPIIDLFGEDYRDKFDILDTLLRSTKTFTLDEIKSQVTTLVSTVAAIQSSSVTVTSLKNVNAKIFQNIYNDISYLPTVTMTTAELTTATTQMVDDLKVLFSMGGGSLPKPTVFVAKLAKIIFNFRMTILASLRMEKVDVSVVVGKMVDPIVAIIGETNRGALQLLVNLLVGSSTTTLDAISSTVETVVTGVQLFFSTVQVSGVTQLVTECFGPVVSSISTLPGASVPDSLSTDKLIESTFQLEGTVTTLLQSITSSTTSSTSSTTSIKQTIISTISQVIWTFKKTILLGITSSDYSPIDILNGMIQPFLTTIGDSNKDKFMTLVTLLTGSNVPTLDEIVAEVTIVVNSLEGIFPTTLSLTELVQLNSDVFNVVFKSISAKTTSTSVAVLTTTQLTTATNNMATRLNDICKSGGGQLPKPKDVVMVVAQTVFNFKLTILVQLRKYKVDVAMVIDRMVQHIVKIIGENNKDKLKGLIDLLSSTDESSDQMSTIVSTISTFVVDVATVFPETVTVSMIVQMNTDIFSEVLTSVSTVTTTEPVVPTTVPTTIDVTTANPNSNPISTFEIISATTQVEDSLNTLYIGGIPSIENVINVVSQAVFTLKTTILAGLSGSTSVTEVVKSMIQPIIDLIGDNNSFMLDVIVKILTSSRTFTIESITSQVSTFVKTIQVVIPSNITVTQLTTLNSEIFSGIYTTIGSVPSKEYTVTELSGIATSLQGDIDTLIKSGGSGLPDSTTVISTITQTIFTFKLTILHQIEVTGSVSIEEIISCFVSKVASAGGDVSTQQDLIKQILTGPITSLDDLSNQVGQVGAALQTFLSSQTQNQLLLLNSNVFYCVFDAISTPGPSPTSTPQPEPTPPSGIPTSPYELTIATTALESKVTSLFAREIPSVSLAVSAVSQVIYELRLVLTGLALQTGSPREIITKMTQPLVDIVGEENVQVLIRILTSSSLTTLNSISVEFGSFVTSTQTFFASATVEQLRNLTVQVFSPVFDTITTLPQKPMTSSELTSATSQLEGSLNGIFTIGQPFPSKEIIVSTVSQTIFNLKLILIQYTSTSLTITELVNQMVRPILNVIGSGNQNQIQVIIDVLTSKSYTMESVTSAVTTLVSTFEGASFSGMFDVSIVIRLNTQIFNTLYKSIEPDTSTVSPTPTTKVPSSELIKETVQIEGKVSVVLASGGTELPASEDVLTVVSQAIFTFQSTVLPGLVSNGIDVDEILNKMIKPILDLIGETKKDIFSNIIFILTGPTAASLTTIEAEVKIILASLKSLDITVSVSQLEQINVQVFGEVYFEITTIQVETTSVAELTSITSELSGNVAALFQGGVIPNAVDVISTVSQTIFSLRITVLSQLASTGLTMTEVANSMIQPILDLIGEDKRPNIQILFDLLSGTVTLSMSDITTKVISLVSELQVIFPKDITVAQLVELNSKIFGDLVQIISTKPTEPTATEPGAGGSTEPATEIGVTEPGATEPTVPTKPTPTSPVTSFQLTSQALDLESSLEILMTSGGSAVPKFDDIVTIVTQIIYKFQTTVSVGLSSNSVDVEQVVNGMLRPVIDIIGDDNRNKLTILITLLTSSSSMTLSEIRSQVETIVLAMQAVFPAGTSVSQLVQLNSDIFSSLFTSISTIVTTSTTSGLTTAVGQLQGDLNGIFAMGIPAPSVIISSVSRIIFTLKITVLNQITTSALTLKTVVTKIIDQIVKVLGESQRPVLQGLMDILTSTNIVSLNSVSSTVTTLINTLVSTSVSVDLTQVTTLSTNVFQVVYGAISATPETPSPLELTSATTAIVNGLKDLLDSNSGQLPATKDVVTTVANAIVTFKTTVLTFITSGTENTNSFVNQMLEPIISVVGQQNRGSFQVIIDILVSTTTITAESITDQVTTFVESMKAIFPANYDVSAIKDLIIQVFSPVYTEISTPGTSTPPQVIITPAELTNMTDNLQNQLNVLVEGNSDIQTIVSVVSNVIVNFQTIVVDIRSASSGTDVTVLINQMINPIIRIVGEGQRSTLEIIAQILLGSSTITVESIRSQVTTLVAAIQIVTSSMTKQELLELNAEIFAPVRTEISSLSVTVTNSLISSVMSTLTMLTQESLVIVADGRSCTADDLIANLQALQSTLSCLTSPAP